MVGARVVTGTCVGLALVRWAGWWAEIGAMGPAFVAVGLVRVNVVGTCRGCVFVVVGAGADPWRCMFFFSEQSSLKA